MAFGAVFLSLPTALTIALYGCVSKGLSTTDCILVYAVTGTAVLLSVTLANGLRPEELH